MALTSKERWSRYYKKHRERLLKEKRQKYWEDPEAWRKKGRDWYAENKHRPEYKGRTKRRYGANLAKMKVQYLKARAKKCGIEFDLDGVGLDIPTHCPVLGIELKKGKGKKWDGSPTVDRIDSSKGYIPDNIHVISYRANQIKSDATPAELKKVAEYFDDVDWWGMILEDDQAEVRHSV